MGGAFHQLGQIASLALEQPLPDQSRQGALVPIAGPGRYQIGHPVGKEQKGLPTTTLGQFDGRVVHRLGQETAVFAQAVVAEPVATPANSLHQNPHLVRVGQIFRVFGQRSGQVSKADQIRQAVEFFGRGGQVRKVGQGLVLPPHCLGILGQESQVVGIFPANKPKDSQPLGPLRQRPPVKLGPGAIEARVFEFRSELVQVVQGESSQKEPGLPVAQVLGQTPSRQSPIQDMNKKALVAHAAQLGHRSRVELPGRPLTHALGIGQDEICL